jgi:hypothetical protein
VNLEPPKASIAKSKGKGTGIAVQVNYCFFYPPLEGGTQILSYGIIPASDYFDASTPSSWTLTLTTPAPTEVKPTHESIRPTMPPMRNLNDTEQVRGL